MRRASFEQTTRIALVNSRGAARSWPRSGVGWSRPLPEGGAQMPPLARPGLPLTRGVLGLGLPRTTFGPRRRRRRPLLGAGLPRKAKFIGEQGLGRAEEADARGPAAGSGRSREAEGTSEATGSRCKVPSCPAVRPELGLRVLLQRAPFHRSLSRTPAEVRRLQLRGLRADDGLGDQEPALQGERRRLWDKLRFQVRRLPPEPHHPPNSPRLHHSPR